MKQQLLKIIDKIKMLLQICFANIILLLHFSYANSSNVALKPCKYLNFNQWYKEAIPKDYEKLIQPLPENVTQFLVKGTVHVRSSIINSHE